MDLCQFKKYVESELQYTYNILFFHLAWKCIKYHRSEEMRFKRSEEYRKIRNKTLKKQPKDMIAQEALNEELAKLGYWEPNKRKSGTHISYAGASKIEELKKQRESSIEFNFKPALTEKQFLALQTDELRTETKDALLHCILNDLADQKTHWSKPPIFDEHCSSLFSGGNASIISFVLEIQDLIQRCKSDAQEARKNIPSRVINGCSILLSGSEREWARTVHVDITKDPYDIEMLGKEIGQTIFVPGKKNIFISSGTYRIEAIMME